MPQSLVQIYLHLVFSTKNRAPFLQELAFRERTHAYLSGICQQQGSPTIQVKEMHFSFGANRQVSFEPVIP